MSIKKLAAHWLSDQFHVLQVKLGLFVKALPHAFFFFLREPT